MTEGGAGQGGLERAARIALALLAAAAGAMLAALVLLQLWLAPMIAWDVRLPLPVFLLLWCAIGVGAGALALRGARFALRGRLLSVRGGLLLALSAFLVRALPSSFGAVAQYYFEPDAYVELAAIDGADWERFEPERWERAAPLHRARLERAWGAFPPARVPLEPVLVEEVRESGYTRQLVELRVEASGIREWDVMRVYLLLPDAPRSTPAPALVVHHQHNGRFDKGKEEPAGVFGDPRQAIGVELARRGYVVAAHDALGFSERREMVELRAVDDAYPAMKLLLHGRTLNGKYAWDVSRLVDYLETRPEVDRSRIGIAGHSLGGQMAIFSALYDPRLSLVVSSCGFGRLDGAHSQLGVPHVYAYATYLPGLLQGEPKLDMKELMGLLRGRFLFLASGTRDFLFPIVGAAEIHAWLEALYAHDAHPERLVTVRHEGGHLLPVATKERIYEFLERSWPGP